jgi:hypothetical protein
VALTAGLWLDPDVRWLTGVHEAEGHFYLVRERYEELLWWLLMPSLLRIAGEASPSDAVVAEMSETIEEALASAEAAGYRVNVLLGLTNVEAVGEEAISEVELSGEAEVEVEATAQGKSSAVKEMKTTETKAKETKSKPSPGRGRKA